MIEIKNKKMEEKEKERQERQEYLEKRKIIREDFIEFLVVKNIHTNVRMCHVICVKTNLEFSIL